jgi:branched-chain amino acid transport system permease protein
MRAPRKAIDAALWIIAWVAVIFALPGLLDRYLLHVAVDGGLAVIFTLGLLTVFGLIGEFMIGYAGLIGFGAYATAILTTQAGFPFWASLPAAIIAAALAGLVVGLFATRFSGHFVAIVTLAFNYVIYNIFLNAEITRGTAGIHGLPSPESFLGLDFDSDGGMYGLVWTVALASAALLHALRHSWAGYAMLAVRDDPVAASASGIAVTRVKLATYCASGAIAGIGGALYASYVGVVEPDQYDFSASISIVAMLLIGGRSSVAGAMLGAVVLSLLPEYLRAVGDYRMLIYSALLVAMMVGAPEGFIGVMRAAFGWAPRLVRGRRSRLGTAA